MQDFLFDTPYWFLGILIVAGVTLWISGNNRQNNSLKRAALASFLLALTLGLLSLFIDTDKEKVIKRTRQLIVAVEKQDKFTAEKLLHPQVELGEMNKAAIVNRIGSAASQFHVKSIRLTSIDVQPIGQDLSAIIAAVAETEFSGFSAGMPSTWNLVWEKTEQGWLLRDIRPINVPGVDMQNLTGRLKAD